MKLSIIIIGVIFEIYEHCYFCEHTLSKLTRGPVIRKSKIPIIQQFTSLEGEGNWAEITFSKTPGIGFRDTGENIWPLADRHVPSNNPRFKTIAGHISGTVRCSFLTWRDMTK